ncbi:hypothetical protein [Hymenobacter glacieicola]|uniref:CBM-cenC domain-containing protein n=1 Tax=Hymenobacter glacieicola TaxID=1562124 RepID=A0ABQ1X5T8_9BACT|nr:hypothetical protein [Hymenobacter glacieicola]GGG60172.1 hypothetical protein GCM10011378_40190 [Hymenobacter glacieicola]
MQENAFGTRFKSVNVPAYTRYASLRSKAESNANKHILSPIAQSYTYKLDANDTPQELLGGSVQTWSNTWTRRVENNGLYTSIAAVTPIWRPQASYAWRAPLVRPTGGTAVGSFTDYNWATGASQHPAWQKLAEIGQVNEYSAGLETRAPLSDATAVVKYGYNNSQVLCRAQNARYGEIAYSGAEDARPNTTFFGGEVGGAALASIDVSHTGQFSVKVNSANPKGFSFNTPISTNEGAKPGRAYQASVWVYSPTTVSPDGRLVATLVDGSATTTLASTSLTTATPVLRAGAWCLLQSTFNVPASAVGKRLEVNCQTTGGTVYFDDFRVAPLTASLEAFVYDSQTWNPTFQLDSKNFYTQFEYNERGQMYKTYVETLSPTAPRRLLTENTSNYARDRKFTISASVTAGSGSVTPTGTTTLYVGDDLLLEGATPSCSWALSASFQVDNVTYWNNATLSDGTQFHVVNNNVAVSNVKGNHSVQVSFIDYGYPAQGTWMEQNCETNSAGCYTGNTIWVQADGCGGYMNREVRPASDRSQCVNPPGNNCEVIVQE